VSRVMEARTFGAAEKSHRDPHEAAITHAPPAADAPHCLGAGDWSSFSGIAGRRRRSQRTSALSRLEPDDHPCGNDGNRRILPVGARPGEGLFSELRAVAQPLLQKSLKMPL
jgi:hypothetical protein